MNDLDIASGDAWRFIIAGDAIFTATSPRTGAHYTFRVRRIEQIDGRKLFKPVWCAYLLVGPNNADDTCYRYLGNVRWRDDYPKDAYLFLKSPEAKCSGMDGRPSVDEMAKWHAAKGAPPFVALNAIVHRAFFQQPLPSGYTLQHEGKCGKCGARLTTQKSIDRGLGPKCAVN